MIKTLKRILNKEVKIQKATFLCICSAIFLGFIVFKMMYGYNTYQREVLEGVIENRFYVEPKESYWTTLTMGDLVIAWMGAFFMLGATRKSWDKAYRKKSK